MPYAEYSLVLPRRGVMELNAESSAFGAQVVLRDGSGHGLYSGTSIRASLEAGTYAVLVKGGGETGPFRLSSSFVPDPNTICRVTAPIGLNEAVTGGITEASCRLPDGTAYDAWSVTTLGAGTLEISMKSDAVHPYLILRSGDGREVASGDRISYVVGADQVYTIVAAAADATTGRYRLSVAFTPGESEGCRPLKSFSASDQDSGQLAAASCHTTDPSTGEPMFFTQYELEVAEAGMAEMRVTSGAFAPALVLLAQDGQNVTMDYWEAAQGRAFIRQQLRAGRYTVLVFSVDSYGGAYLFEYGFRPGAPEACPVTTLDNNQQRVGTLTSASSCRTAEGLADIYRITTPGPGTLEIAITSEEFDTYLSLRDARDSRIVADDNGGYYGDSYLAAELPAGTYSVVATGQGGAGAYAIAYRFTPHQPTTCASLAALGDGYTYGLFGQGNCTGPNGQQADFYEFTTGSDGLVALTMSSDSVDSVVTLLDSEGRVLRRDDNSLDGVNSLLIQYLPAGTYRVMAQGAESGRSGYYALGRNTVPGDRPAGCMPLRTLSLGDTVDATLDLPSCQYPDATFADVYQIDITETIPVRLTLESSDFDTELLLVDAKGNVLKADDDSAGGTNARISQALTPGAYYVLAKSHSGYATGGYRLSVARGEDGNLAYHPNVQYFGRLLPTLARGLTEIVVPPGGHAPPSAHRFFISMGG